MKYLFNCWSNISQKFNRISLFYSLIYVLINNIKYIIGHVVNRNDSKF